MEKDIINWRRDLHQIPEVGLDLPQTSAYVAKQLKEMGIPYKEKVGVSGIVGLIEGGQPGKTIALRADMDALPIKEETGLPFASQNGNMHACGHDAHTAILLGVAKVLNENKDKLKGNVKLIFQPAEEGPGGAKPMIDEGALENPKVDAVMGLHVGNLTDNAKEGIIMVSYDSMMACLDRFRVKLIGKGCHGAYPETGIDPVAMAGYFLTNLQAIVSREIGATDPAVITVGKINGGFAYNIIPDSVELEGTVRAVDQSVREYISNRIEDLAKGISETWIDIINAVNSIAMNRYIIRINDRKNADRLQLRSDNFRKKIETIVANLSEEINYPISIIDVLENKIFNYPNKDFSLKEDISYLKGEDFPFNYQKEILGDRLNIYRITNIEEKDMWSFIVMPIVLKGVTVSKLIVWEDQGEVDYYDLFSLRLTYILLLEVYEQIYLMNSFERRFYDDLIKSLIDGEIDTKQKLIKSITSIEDFKLDIDSRFTAIFNDRSKGL